MAGKTTRPNGIWRKASWIGVLATLPALGIGTATFAATPSSHAAASTPAMATQAVAALSSPAVSLRLTLERLMGAHAFLALRAMDEGYSGAPNFSATVATLNGNTEALTSAVASVYGWKAGATFRKVWTAHIGFFVDYVVATKKGDKAGQTKALADLQGYATQSSEFFAGLNPHLNAAMLKAGLETHITQIISAFQDYVHGNYSASATETVDAYDHMFAMGDALATGIAEQFPSKFPGNPNGAGANLNSALDQLLGAHAFLALNAMEEGYAGLPDFAGTTSALNANTQGLASAIASVYGPAAGTQFAKLWSAHIGFFVNFVMGWKNQDLAGRTTALDDLAGYKTQFAQFLLSANPNVDPVTVADALQVHIHELVGTFDSYRQSLYSKAATGQVYAYDHMFMTGGYLASVIVKQYPSKFGA